MIRHGIQYSAGQSQKAISAYFTSKQIRGLCQVGYGISNIQTQVHSIGHHVYVPFEIDSAVA